MMVPAVPPRPPALPPSVRASAAPADRAAAVPRSDPVERPAASRRDGAASPATPGRNADNTALSRQEQQQLRELRRRDREVRAHEAAHQAAGGRYAGPASFEFERGPDGVRYAVAGEVDIDVAPVPGDPEATIDKMRIVRAAALAPINPSAQDQAVAARATRELVEARAELARSERESADGGPRTATPVERALRTYREFGARAPIPGAV